MAEKIFPNGEIDIDDVKIQDCETCNIEDAYIK